MVSVLEEAKFMACPVIVHIKTRKGLGFAPAEEHPERYHSTGGFSIDGSVDSKPKKRTFTDQLSDSLCEMAAKNRGIVGITAAMTDGCGLANFAGIFPERFFDVGIAEEHAVTTAAGLAIGGAKEGILPALVMYSTFSQRVFDQLWHDIALQKDVHVMLLLSHAGLVPGDGVTHQGIYDVSLISRIPGATIYSPDDFDSFDRSLKDAEAGEGLTVVRYPKAGEAKYACSFSEHPTWKSTGSGETVVVTYGRVAENVVKAAEMTKDPTTVVVLRRIFPLPEDEEFKSLINSAKRVIFVEESIRSGGIGEQLASADWVCGKVEIKAITDPFVPHGDPDYLMKLTGLDPEGILEIIDKR